MIVNFLLGACRPGKLLVLPELTDALYEIKNTHVYDGVYDGQDDAMMSKLLKTPPQLHNETSQVLVINPRAELLRVFLKTARLVYMRYFDKHENVTGFTLYELDDFGLFEIVDYTDSQEDVYGNTYRDITYTKRDTSNLLHQEYVYLRELTSILLHGEKDRPDRTGVGTISSFGHQLRFDISKSIPLLTTKFVAFQIVLKELLWFLRGETDSKTLEAQGVTIWRLNSTREFLDTHGLNNYREGTIGPMYGWIWNHLGASYDGPDADYTNKGINQLENLVIGLKTDPFSRRHMITTYAPQYATQGVLYPCHGIVAQFYVSTSRELSCHVYCRSQDTFLGQPFNIASYTILTYILAKMCDMTPKELILSTGDTHIYSNHVDQVYAQLARKPLPFPVLEISETVRNKSFHELDTTDFNLIGYMYHPAIKAPMAV